MSNNIIRTKIISDIVESNSNANGSYIKYIDGTMICWGKVTASLALNQGPNSGFYYATDNVTFPQPFSSNNISMTSTARISGDLITSTVAMDAVTTTAGSIYFLTPVSHSAQTVVYSWQAIGKWASVSNATAGIPAISIGRGIIESGSNSDGSYIKYEDGTMECWFLSSATVTTTNSNGGVWYVNSTAMNFPAPFSAVPVVDIIAGGATAGLIWPGGFYSLTASAVAVRIIGGSATAAGTYGYHAMGRWQSATNMVGPYTYGQGITETGTNSNGTYIKFDNGTLICTKQYGNVSLTASTTYSANNFPYSFVGELPVMSISGVPASVWGTVLSTYATSLSLYNYSHYNPSSATQTVNGVSITAIGRWK